MEPFLKSERLAALPWLVHGFGTRVFRSADFGRHPETRGFGVVWMKQTHSAEVRVIGAVPPVRLVGDALLTAAPGLIVAVRTADCLPILLADEDRRVVGAVHAGWRGTALRIAAAAVAAMGREFGTRPESLLAALGPCMGPSCYEVGADVAAAFEEAGLKGGDFAPCPGRPDRWRLDLAGANRRQLEEAGLQPGRIESAGRCTHCEPALLSWRRDRDPSGRLYNFIGIRG